MGPFGKASPDPFFLGPSGKWITRVPEQRRHLGGQRETGQAICRWALGLDREGGGVPQAGAGCNLTLSPTPTPTRSLIPQELPKTLQRPLCGFIPRPAGVPGASSESVPAPTADLACPAKQAGVTQDGQRRGAAAARPQNPCGPASQRAPQWRDRGLPGLGHARPGSRRPPAWSPEGRQPACPGPGAEPGAGAEPGRRPVSGCSGNGDVLRRGRGKHAGCIF